MPFEFPFRKDQLQIY